MRPSGRRPGYRSLSRGDSAGQDHGPVASAKHGRLRKTHVPSDDLRALVLEGRRAKGEGRREKGEGRGISCRAIIPSFLFPLRSSLFALRPSPFGKGGACLKEEGPQVWESGLLIVAVLFQVLAIFV